MPGDGYNLLVVLGPTATGKTHLAVELARRLGGEVVSADSRQVYRGLDIGAGKDLDAYQTPAGPIAHHLIDIVDLDQEFSLFDFQRQFYRVFEEIRARGVMPVLAGGSGLYLESVLLGYELVAAPRDDTLRAELACRSMEQLGSRLRALQGRLHNTTDLTSRERAVRAIEIAEYARRNPPPPAPAVRSLVLGIRMPRRELRERIRTRLVARVEQGLVEEVEGLRARGVSWERLDSLGLEYRWVARYLRGEIENRNDLVQKLHAAICRFAKRQESWFRRMERRGVRIRWLESCDPDEAWAGIQPHRPAP